ncbi:hypothetical protein C0991_009677 [Blastosporella zonata]|nr:hypothetical protein C0991_009677 [Blastosporella zonata]
MHKGIDSYLEHKLSLAPMVKNARQILEIGCGSGAWAIQAAKTYPDATVTAIDVSPLPPRPLPRNMQFLQLNVTEPLPFEPESFDIIHARFVFLHLQHWEKVLEHVVSLLKPNGWLWIEDLNSEFYDDGICGPGPFIKKLNDIYGSHMHSLNVNPLVGSELQSVLERMEIFSKVNSVKIRCPMNGKDKDPRIGRVGSVMFASMSKALLSMDLRVANTGITRQVVEGALREVSDPSRSGYMKMHMTWSQKKK